MCNKHLQIVLYSIPCQARDGNAKIKDDFQENVFRKLVSVCYFGRNNGTLYIGQVRSGEYLVIHVEVTRGVTE